MFMVLNHVDAAEDSTTDIYPIDASTYHDVKNVLMIVSPLFKVPAPVSSSCLYFLIMTGPATVRTHLSMVDD